MLLKEISSVANHQKLSAPISTPPSQFQLYSYCHPHSPPPLSPSSPPPFPSFPKNHHPPRSKRYMGGKHILQTTIRGAGSSLQRPRRRHPQAPASVVPLINSADRQCRSTPNFLENQMVLASSSRPVRPIPKSVSFNVTSWRRPHPPMEPPASGPSAESKHAPAPVPYVASRQAPATSLVNGRVDAPAPGLEADWMVHHPPSNSQANLNNAPIVMPAILAPMFPDSEISLPPKGCSDTVVSAPVGLDLVAPEKRSVSIMETSSGDLEGAIETTEKSKKLDGVRKCDVGIGLASCSVMLRSSDQSLSFNFVL